MSDTVSRPPRLEKLLADLLHYGTWVASITIGLGLVFASIDSRWGTRNLAVLPEMRIATMGIVLLILLPSFRVLLMLLVFLRDRDYRLAVTAGLVLMIILLGLILSIRKMSPAAG